MDPVWDAKSSTFAHEFNADDNVVVTLIVMDYDLFGSNDFIGMVVIKPDAGKRWYKLTDKDGATEEDLGEVEVSIKVDDGKYGELTADGLTLATLLIEAGTYIDPTNMLPEDVLLKLNRRNFQIVDEVDNKKVYQTFEWGQVSALFPTLVFSYMCAGR